MKTSIFDIENWREIGATLSRNKTRTFLTAFGIFWGTAMLAMLWGGASGFEGIMRRNFEGFATNMGAVFASERSMSYRGFNKGSSWTLTTEDVENIRRIAPYIEYSSQVNWAQATASFGDKSKDNTRAIGVESNYDKLIIPVIYEGRFINEADEAADAKVTLIGKNLATTLFGNDSPVGKYVSFGGIYFKVVGVVGQTSDASIMGRLDDSLLMPAGTLRRAFNRGNQLGGFVFTSARGHKPSENDPYILRAIRINHPIHPDDTAAVSTMDVSDMFDMVDKIFMGISLLALFVGMGSLMAGVIGVGNIMWIVVKERTHEFGIRRAIGATPADITLQVLSESVLLTLISGIAGVCFAALVLGIADKATMHPSLGAAGFQLPFASAVAVVVLFFVLGSAAGTLPAVKAMHIKPIEALRDK